MTNGKCKYINSINTYDCKVVEIKNEKTYSPEEIAFYNAQQDLQYRKPKNN